jgi:hypothetical protein
MTTGAARIQVNSKTFYLSRNKVSQDCSPRNAACAPRRLSDHAKLSGGKIESTFPAAKSSSNPAQSF